jgi:short-subunit dehydrogenase
MGTGEPSKDVVRIARAADDLNRLTETLRVLTGSFEVGNADAAAPKATERLQPSLQLKNRRHAPACPPSKQKKHPR